MKCIIHAFLLGITHVMGRQDLIACAPPTVPPASLYKPISMLPVSKIYINPKNILSQMIFNLSSVHMTRNLSQSPPRFYCTQKILPVFYFAW